MSKILMIDAKLAKLSEREAQIKLQKRLLESQRKKESFRLRSAMRRLVGEAYLAALKSGLDAPTREEVLSYASAIAGERHADTLAQLKEHFASSDTTECEAATERSSRAPAPVEPAIEEQPLHFDHAEGSPAVETNGRTSISPAQAEANPGVGNAPVCLKTIVPPPRIRPLPIQRPVPQSGDG